VNARRTGPKWRASLSRPKIIIPWAGLLVLAGLLLASPSAVSAQEAVAYFRQNCMSCHTIGGGRLTGPDLKGVGQRKDRPWLARFLIDPPAMVQSGDPYAAKLAQEARGVVMPKVAGMTRQRAEAMLDFLEAESKLPRSQFAGVASDKPFTSADAEVGRNYFLGVRPLAGGGPPCIACHSVRGTGTLGGGRLGPDLSRVYERLGGQKNLAAWLSAPATPTMQTVFAARPLDGEEIHALSAFFAQSAKQGGEADPSGTLAFFLLGLGGAVVILAGMDAVWRGRFRAVRRRLVPWRLEGE